MSNIVTKQINGMTMYLDLNDGGISGALWNKGNRELAFMSIMHDTVTEGMTCIDLGSNIGYTTLVMLNNVGDNGMVYAIEPDPHNLDLLTKSIEANNFMNRVEIIQAAISNTDGELDFWMAENGPNLSSVQKTKHSTKKITVPCHSLNKFLEDRKYPNFIKMDIEGHEVQVFEGGLDYFDKHHEGNTNILLEVHPQFYDDENDFGKMVREYYKLGFEPKYVVSTPIYRPDLFVEAGYEPLQEIPTDGFHRGIYDNISKDDVIRFACQEHSQEYNGGRISKKIVRSFMLTRKNK